MRQDNGRWKVGRMALLAAFVLALAAGMRAGAQGAKLKFLAEGAATRVNGMRPRPLDMAATRPEGITKLPPGVSNPVFGVLTLGAAEAPTRFVALMDAPKPDAAGKYPAAAPRVWIDANANGDLTDDPPVRWERSEYKNFDGSPLNLFRASVALQTRFKEQTLSLRINLMRYDPNDPNRDLYRNTLLCVADYAREGEVTIAGTAYRAMLYDAFTLGDFRGKREPNSGIGLFMDLNHNGEYDARGEIYDAFQPFNIKGVTYEVAGMAPDGSAFEIVKSKQTVPEIPPPPDLRVGKTILSFERKTLDGKTAHFPADYKGRLVMLYFWASYCPICQGEIPFVRGAYRQLHAKGLDILGVSVDPADLPIPLAQYTAESGMPWAQIYEGKYWNGDLIKQFFITTIPTPFLVDGDTGKILAVGDDLKGARLASTLQKALDAKVKK